MAIVLRIDNGDNRGRVDYTRYLASPDRSPAVLRDRMNLPTLFDFTLVPADQGFVPPRRSAFVHLEGLADSLPPGGPRVPGPLFTGFITNEPIVEFLGTFNGQPVHGYRCQATSEEYLLNVKRIGLLPPFLNQTAGQILRFLAEHLQPGRFDTTSVADGTLIPLFIADPDRSWSEIARELAKRSGFYYRVLDGDIIFQPIGDLPVGVTVDEKDRRFRPESLEITPIGNPIHNDVTVLGGIEPQAFVREYFVGDGFTSRFLLSFPIFGAESSRLLADDFTGPNLDTLRWKETDPNNTITIFEGRLNVIGGSAALGQTTLVARQAVELGGELEIIHGEFEFVSPSIGILGGLYSDTSLTQGSCLAGFDAAPIAATTRLRAIVSGVVQPLEVIVQANHHYVLVTKLSADQPFRILQSFASLGSNFGGTVLPARVRVTLEVRDFDLSTPATPAVTELYSTTLDTLPAIVVYAPINSVDLHLVMNFVQVTRPIQARLETERPGEPSRGRTLGFGIAGQDATISADLNQNQWALEFYEDTIPARGEKIIITYRTADRAKARVRDSAGASVEALSTGDDGVRAVVLQDINPLPRTSSEAERAAQAYLADHSAPRYEGRYATWSEFADTYPRSGRFLEIRTESRYPAFSALVRSVTSEIRELATERILHTLEFGQPSLLEEMLERLIPEEDVLRAREDISLPPVEVTELDAQFVADLPSLSVAQVVATHFLVDAGSAPPGGGTFEVRRSDQGWSNPDQPGTEQNLILQPTTQTFVLARTSRNHLFLVRPVAASGATSRFSSVLGIHFPLVPLPPQNVTVTLGLDSGNKPIISVQVEVAENAIQDVDRVELRDGDNSTVLAQWTFGQLQLEGGLYHASLTIDNSADLTRSKTVFAYTQNVLGEYSSAVSTTGSQPEPIKPSLAPGNSVGQILEILLDRTDVLILETEIQVAGPSSSFSAPDQDVLLPGQPEKFNFVAPQSGGWAFRARRRDPLGWSPWSNESQGQLPPETLVFSVQFFRARELDPSVGAAVNAQNLLPNSEFFLPGLAGQEGIHAARYFSLVNAAADGTEVDYLQASNEMQWKANVNLGTANPGLRSLLSNLGRLFNPAEPLTLSAALRHNGTLPFDRAVRFALRSASTPSYDQSVDVAAGTIGSNYRWYSATMTLPANQAVPTDLSAEITVVVSAGQALSSDLFCDKVILNRGHRPAAFSLATWDIVALVWNPSTGAYDLPATLVTATPRSADLGGAGLLVGTGTEDLDPGFTDRYFRVTAS